MIRGILEKEDAGRLFLNIETLYDLNCKFLAALESLQARSYVVTDPVGPVRSAPSPLAVCSKHKHA